MTVEINFPQTLFDLDGLSKTVLEMGEDLPSDHVGATDPVYRARRKEICTLAKEHQTGKPIPTVKYTDIEIETWGVVYNKLKELYPTHACRAHLNAIKLMEEECGFTPNNIPQLEDISNFLFKRTGWTIRPVTGLLTPRAFLNSFALKVFHATQYIRHHSKPLYTPEPDICHELLGHAPLFADPDFAAFSHAIGMASLGASDDDITRLSTFYWFTTEFGLCREDNELRAYGAGLLSSFGELEYCLSEQPKLQSLVPEVASVTPYPITEYQPLYFVAESFEKMKEQMVSFGQSIERPYDFVYNPETQSITFKCK
jgi:phenylalanine-4-hydroxylase